MKFMKFLLDRNSTKQAAENHTSSYRVSVPINIIGLLVIFALAATQGQAATVKDNGSSGSAPVAEAPDRAHAEKITVPPVPADIQVPAGNEAFLVGHGVGTQNYVCAPCDPTKPNCPLGVAFALFTPQATLFNDEREQLTTHFFSPNPFENNTIRATWEDSKDTSTVWGKVIGSNVVTQGAIPWLLVDVTGTQAGPTGGDKLTRTTFIQRLNTVGGVAPSTGCLSTTDLGNSAFVPYRSDYFFYKAIQAGDN